MKKTIFYLFVLAICLPLSAQKFDETNNYQGKNAMAYLNQELVVMPIKTTGHQHLLYRNFKLWIFDNKQSNFDSRYIYRDGKLQYSAEDLEKNAFGTEVEDLLYKRWYVYDVEPMADYKNHWILSMRNVDNSDDLCKYVYDDSKKFIDLTGDFPFLCIAHADWLREKYMGKKVVVSTKKFASCKERLSYDHRFSETDLKTGEVPVFNSDYEIFTVKNIEIVEDCCCICFTIENENHQLRVTANLLYEENPIYSRTFTRIFTLNEWNMLCNKYSKDHMLAIINTKIIAGMTIDEALMSCGTPDYKENKGEYTEYEWFKDAKYVCKVDNNGKIIEVVSTANKSALNDFKDGVKDGYNAAAKPIKETYKSAFNVAKDMIKSLF